MNGFWAGPACDRVAVVDFSVEDGSLRPVAELDPKGSQYRSVGLYDVPTPTCPAAAPDRGFGLQDLAGRAEHADGDTGFIKVSVFGTVIRTIAFVEDPVVLGRPVEWAFGGRQILVVPSAGTLDNAFYHRPSRSLQFFSYDAPGSGRRLHTALSQDIVAHETAHALVDGIAPDLYDAVSPDSLAIHESAADMTAAMISLRSRDPARGRPTPAEAIDAVVRSSRYSRMRRGVRSIRGQDDALRDAINDRTLNPRARTSARVVDRLSPHSLSEVLTGAMFSVLVSALTEALTLIDAGRDVPEIRVSSKESDPFRIAAGYAINRVGSMLFKGLDWLPPGEATFADVVRAMLAADRFHHPDLPDERDLAHRRVLQAAHRRPSRAGRRSRGCGRRPVEVESATSRTGAKPHAGSSSATAIAWVFPPGPSMCDRASRYASTNRCCNSATPVEQVALERPYPQAAETDRIVIVKASWWESQRSRCRARARRAATSGWGCRRPSTRRVGSGMLRYQQGQPPMDGRRGVPPTAGRLGRAARPGGDLGPDGEPLRARVPTTVSDGRLRVSGAFQALHIADAG